MKHPKLLATAAGVAAVGAAVALAPLTLSGVAKRKIVEAAAERGLDVTIGELRLDVGGATVHDLCVAAPAPHADRSLACVERLRVSAAIGAAIRGDVKVSGVTVEGGFVDASAAMGTPDELRAMLEELTRGADRPGHEGGEQQAPRAEGDRAPAPETSVEIDGFELRLDGQPLPLAGLTLDGVRATIGATSQGTGAITLRDLDLADLGVTVAPTLQLEVSGSGLDDAVVKVTAAMSATLPGELAASVESVEFSAPHTLAVSGLSVRRGAADAPTASVAADRVELELRALTTDVEQLYMARASVVRPRVSLALDALGSAAAPADGSGDADAGDADAGDADAGAPAAAAPSPADPAEEPGLWGDRRWWERIPQRIDVTDGEVTLSRTVDGQPRTLSASGLRLAYALRAIGLQADVELDATLRRGDEPAGTVDIDAVWRWADEALTLDATLTDLDVGAAALLTPGLAALEPAGRADLRVRVRETESHALEDFSGQVTVRDVSVAVPVLQAPLAVPSASFEWRASRDEGRDAALVFIEGNGRLGEAAFELRPTIHGFNYHRERFGDSVDVDFVVPDQDASVLLHSVPRSLLGAVADAELTGRWGLSIAFPITFGQVPEGGGRRPIEIGETTRYEVRDEGLRLVSLPEAVDVRRLSGAFSFVFSRPGGGPPRTLSVRPPRDAGQIEGVEYGEPARWARLGDMSYFFIAATLYQEDGRFFRNHGINWFQWRQVLAQAWQEGELGRGASTISMQLVKNLFLTHERTVERKLQELFLTYWMTRLIPKERILETYFNVIELGPGVNGIFEAAAYYFGKSPNELTLAESVWLSSIIPAPARRGRQRDAGVAAEWSQRLAGDIMRGMESRGWITASELSRGLAETVRFVTAGGAPPATTGGDDAAWEGDEREARDEARDDALRELGVVDVIDGGGAGDLDLTDLALVDPADLAAAGTDALAPTGPDRIAALIATSIPLRTGSE